MLNVVLIDDDEIAICLLINQLKKLTSFEVNIVGTAANLDAGVDLINKKQPDIVFLDIKMPGKSGLEIYKEFKSFPFSIIFCTSYQQYAIEALQKSVDGYLLKPIDFIELQETIQRISEKRVQEQNKLLFENKFISLNAPEMQGVNIFLETVDGFILKNTRNIEYCYANQAYSVVVTNEQKEITISKSLKELQEILPENQFYRTHKSYLINIYYIRKFVHLKDSYVILKSGVKIPVSDRITPYILNDINQKLLI
jgi:two-component system LytT family response regulator